MTTQIRRLVAGLLAFAAFGAAAGSGVALASTHDAHAAAHHRKHHKRHHSRIPQHNGGDHDADNNGGPSDGDGNI